MVIYLTDVPDLGPFFRMVLDWVLYPWQNWTFNFLDVFHFPLYYYAVGCFLLGLTIHFIFWLAGDKGRVAMILGRLFG